MSYVKLHKVVQDFAVGVQSVNQATDNNEALHAQFLARHTEEFDAAFNLFTGRHDDRLISRAVVRCIVNNSLSPPELALRLSSPLLAASQADTRRLGTGHWRIGMRSKNITSVVPQADGTTDEVATARVVGNYIEVETWSVTAAAHVDVDFSLVLWAYDV